MVENSKIFQAYYTYSNELVDYMLELLDLAPLQKILEPAAGDGVFIKAVLQKEASVQLDAYELNPASYQTLQTNYAAQSNVRLFCANTLFDEALSQRQAYYERIIANPPYGAWLEPAERKKLKALYPEMYVKETYGLFLYRCLKLLKEEGKLVFIVPDTFLNLHRHTALRKYLLENTDILELCLFPSSFFPNVNFAYANLSIICLQKRESPSQEEIKIYQGFQKIQELHDPIKRKQKLSKLSQASVFQSMDYAFFVSENSKVTAIINEAEARIGDIADCVTGFYSGDDKHFLKTRLDRKHYSKIIESEIYQGDYSLRLREGLNNGQNYIPIVKGGAQKYYKPNDWYMRWDEETVAFYKQSKKARYQNSSYYFRNGLAVPMVSSSQITAALLDCRLFDQSIVGVFPKDEAWILYLLAFFNSPSCNQLIRTLNPSANNSANYLRKIPFISPNQRQFEQVKQLSEQILFQLRQNSFFDAELELAIQDIFRAIYGF